MNPFTWLQDEMVKLHVSTECWNCSTKIMDHLNMISKRYHDFEEKKTFVAQMKANPFKIQYNVDQLKILFISKDETH